MRRYKQKFNGEKIIHFKNDDEYFADEAINSSWLKLWLKSPEHFFDHTPQKNTDTLRLGSAFHAVILNQPFVNFGPRLKWNTKEGKVQQAEVQAYAASSTGAYLFDHELEMFQNMKAAMRRHPAIGDRFDDENVVMEKGFSWAHETGLRLKAKPDIFYTKILKPKVIVWDAKTCNDASPYGFEKACRDYHYPLSGALYRRGLRALTGLEVSPMYFIMIEKDPPHYVGVYRVSDNDHDYIDRWIDAVLPEIQTHAHQSGRSPYINKKHRQGIHVAQLPEYYIGKFETY